MFRRRIEKTAGFNRDLKRLRRHSGLNSKAQDILQKLASGQITDGNQLKGMEGKPVYKIRCGTKNMGARRGARIIYYKDDSKLIALHIYVKNDKENVPSKEIMTFLKENGL